MIWLQISSGRGPGECEIATNKLANKILADAKSAGIEAEIIDCVQGRDGWISCILSIQDSLNTTQFCGSYIGPILWVCSSSIRPNWKRKNWFVSVSELQEPNITDWNIQEKDLQWETMRSSGKGGQNVNKTETCVRVKHLPTGISTTCQNERSQLFNKKLALAKLMQILQERNNTVIKNSEKNKWAKHNNIERGNPVKTFIGENFIEKV